MNAGQNPTDFVDDSANNDWYDQRWKKRKRIVIPKHHITDGVVDFPLLINLENDPDIAEHARSDGRDIVFTGADGTTRLPHQQIVHQRLLRKQAVWTIWSGPRAIRYVGHHDRTYIAYYTTNNGWWISAYDHMNSDWQHYQLRSHEQSTEGRWWDDHNNPALTIRQDGHLIVVYGEHSTERSWFRISSNPEDISSWQNEVPFRQEQQIAKRSNNRLKHFVKRVWAKLTNTKRPKLYDPAYSYVNLYTLSDGTIWRHYRPLTGWSGISRNPTFVISRDGGSTWSDPVQFIKEENRSPYLVTAQEDNKIHFFFSDAHPDEWNKTSIYHAYYDHSHGTYHKSDGTLIGDETCLPFTPAQATKIFDGTSASGEAWVYDIAVDEEGRIAGLFNVYSGEKDNKKSYQVHEYWYAIWNGKGWKTNRIDSESNIFSTGQKRYSGGFVADMVDVSQVYLSLVDRDGTEDGFTRHIWRYQTDDNGSTWNRTRISKKGQGKAHSRPVVPVNRHPDLPVVWQYGHYVNYLEYRTALAAGDHGSFIDSQHHVRIPKMTPYEDLSIYVYYGNDSIATDPSLPREKVWPESCLMAYRGTLTQNTLGLLQSEDSGSAITMEMVAVWASDRKGAGEAAIITSDPQAKIRLWIGKSRNNKLEVRLMSSSSYKSIIFDDLIFHTRPWREAYKGAERSFIQLSLLTDGSVYARMNGSKSHLRGEFSMLSGISPADLGHLRSAPEPDEGIPFQGWVEAFRVFHEKPEDSWLNMSAVAETEGSALLNLSSEEQI